MKQAKVRPSALFLFLFLFLLLLLLLGVSGSFRLSARHLAGGATCPMLGPVPACILVAAIYLTMLFTQPEQGLVNARKRLLFWTALTVGGGLALLGTILELMGQDICPPGPFGWPMCYVSLALCLAIGRLAFGLR